MPTATESPSAYSSSSDSPGRYSHSHSTHSRSIPNTPSVIRSNLSKGGGFTPTITRGTRTTNTSASNSASASASNSAVNTTLGSSTVYTAGLGSSTVYTAGDEEETVTEEPFDQATQQSQQRYTTMTTIRAQHVPSQRPVSLALSYPYPPVPMPRVPSDVSKPFDERNNNSNISYNNNNNNKGGRQQLPQQHSLQPAVVHMGRINSEGSRPFDQKQDETTSAGAVLDSSGLNISSETAQAVSAPASEHRSLTDWEHTPPRQKSKGNINSSHRSYYSDTHDNDNKDDNDKQDNEYDASFGRFRMTPPRLSPPRNLPYQQGTNGTGTTADREGSDDSRDLSAVAHLSGKSPPRETNTNMNANMKQQQQNVAVATYASYEEFGMNTNTNTDNDTSNTNGSVTAMSNPRVVAGARNVPQVQQQQQQQVQQQQQRRQQQRAGGTGQEQGDGGTDDDDKGDDDNSQDSLFNFEEEARRKNTKAVATAKAIKAVAKAKANKNGRRGRRLEDLEEYDEGDNTSLDQDYGAVTPQTNLQERTQAAWKRKYATAAAKRTVSPDRDRETQSVSFGKGDTVYTFEPDLDATDNDNDETLDTKSISLRSLNSEYTKSAESEVEDVIKDMFMIGTQNTTKPGRRKVKYSPAAKHRLDRLVDPADDFEEETTLDLSDTGEETEKKYTSSSSRRDRGRSSTRRGKSMKAIDESREEDDPFAGVWGYVEGGINAVSNVLGLEAVSSSGSLEKPIITEKRSDAKAGKQKADGFQGLFDYYSDILLAASTESSASCKPPVQRDAQVEPMRVIETEEPEEDLTSPPSLEEDFRLVDLAIQAARSAHRLQGYEFDETYDVNIVTDIKFSVVDLKLPLGLIFQENDGGCWVTKVLPEGTAIKSRSVKVGDQLAAIDGISAIRLTVDEIAKTIKGKKAVIELTFLRYVGPLKPAAGDIEEEGYEVKASKKKDPPGEGDPVKGRSRRSKKNKEVQPKSPTRAQESRDRPSAMAVQGEEAGNGKKRFRWFGRKKPMDAE
jgi:hypothetical protein